MTDAEKSHGAVKYEDFDGNRHLRNGYRSAEFSGLCYE